MDLAAAERLVKSMNSTVFNCPHCGHEHDGADCENAQHYVTFWGEGGPQEFECDSCGVEFYIKESVSRSFEAGKSQNDFY